MILRSRGSDVPLGTMAAEWGNESIIPLPGQNFMSYSSVPVTWESALGLPAVGSVLRSVGDLCATLPFMTYKSRDERTKDADAWQWDVLHDKPAVDGDPFQFWYDVFVSLEAVQNVFIQKVKLGEQVIEVQVIDPQRVRCYRDPASGRKLFDIHNGNGYQVTKGLTTDDILHVRGFTPAFGGVVGVSLLEVHRNPLGAAIAMLQFEGDYFSNGAQPPFWFTGMANKQQAEDVMDTHNQRHKGAGRQWKPGALWGNADVKALPISMKDAMFIEAKNMSIEDVCRIWRWPRRLMELGEQAPVRTTADDADTELLKMYILPRLKRIESAFNADTDFYYGSEEYGEFMIDALERGAVHTRYDAYRLARQGGWMTANEMREKENLPAHPDGDELQMTPVGGAANPDTPPAKELPAPTNGNGNGNGHDSEARERTAALIAEGGVT